MQVTTFALMYAAMASALNITAGFIGYPAFGDVVWFGLGATVTGTLMVAAGWPFVAAVPVAVLVCGVMARSSALPCSDSVATTSRSARWLSTSPRWRSSATSTLRGELRVSRCRSCPGLRNRRRASSITSSSVR